MFSIKIDTTSDAFAQDKSVEIARILRSLADSILEWNNTITLRDINWNKVWNVSLNDDWDDMDNKHIIMFYLWKEWTYHINEDIDNIYEAAKRIEENFNDQKTYNYITEYLNNIFYN